MAIVDYRDAVQEGDGEQVLLCWKYMLPIFKATNRCNYAYQLVWFQFVNIHGKGIPGHNIPCDLHIEHMNRLCKMCVGHLGANKTPKAISRFSKCMGPMSNIVGRFNHEHKCCHSSGSHTTASADKDRDLLIEELKKYSILSPTQADIIPPSKNLFATLSRHLITMSFINGLFSTPKPKVLT